MLRALELYGFKSFADRTRFDFGAGITVVVGPNGSGKSNIVDAMKWVLGEQSAKSLRGRDMADVIFKGSGSRRPMNSAEATIVFDNSDRILPVDTAEVHVTRRVYRSGEGEYLLNGQPCRLRDIKDLFRGTGVGTDAYSLIEQGKVDSLLQTSPRERRALFEEAAGISRFKAKKVETQRRLERVDQNLLRLSDIVDEVESRLRAVRAQAGKAQRYQEYTTRLQELRTQVGLHDWRRLTKSLEEARAKLAATSAQAAEEAARCERLEAEGLELDTAFTRLDEQVRRAQHRLTENREQIASHHSTCEHERARRRDLEQEEERLRRQWVEARTRSGDSQQRLAENTAALAAARAEFAALEETAGALEAALAELEESRDQLRRVLEERRRRHVEQMRAAGELARKLAAQEADIAAAREARARADEVTLELAEESASLEKEREQLAGRCAECAAECERETAALAAARENVQALRARREEQRERLGALLNRQSGARERADVLEDLEQRFEGVGAGPKEVLARLKQLRESGEPLPAPWSGVRGLLADVLHVPLAFAPLIDAVLAEAARHVVVADDGLRQAIRAGEFTPAGRLGLLPLQYTQVRRGGLELDLTADDEVVARADQLIECEAPYRPLAVRLLSDVWIVRTLDAALALAARPGAGRLRFVTLAGDVLLSDGTLIAAGRKGPSGVMVRRSELRSLREELQQLEGEIAGCQAAGRQVAEQLAHAELEAEGRAAGRQQLAEQLARLQAAAEGLAQRGEQLQLRESAARAEAARAESRQRELVEQHAVVERERGEVEASLAALEAEMAESDQAMQSLEAQWQERQQQAGAMQVRRESQRQKLLALESQQASLEADGEERRQLAEENERQLEQCVRRQRVSLRRTLQSSSMLAELFLLKEALEREQAVCGTERGALLARRAEMAEQLQRLRKQLRQSQEAQHRQEMAAAQWEHERNTLAERLRDDYGIELAGIERPESDEELHEREEVEAEIEALRRKINSIGAVNLEALAELEELESRFESLSSQHRDLVEAKQALERIIHRINADSRRMFRETIEAIRTNFQALFRKVFGGGRADIVLEEGVDILEAGVEIVAMPPGKNSLSISLLSGGERALTAVTLLLAIFQFRPSPFCVLDEVDGPLDEANIGRFIDVLREFLDWTRFVVVTHSKKTMTAATVLYGVTMQESGISKRVSVQFDDVHDDGRIRREAVERAEEEEAA